MYLPKIVDSSVITWRRLRGTGGGTMYTQSFSAATATMNGGITKSTSRSLSSSMATMAGTIVKLTKKFFSAQ